MEKLLLDRLRLQEDFRDKVFVSKHGLIYYLSALIEDNFFFSLFK